MRITYNKLKEWTESDAFFKEHNLKLQSHSGFYYIYDENGEMLAAGKTPNECWREFCVFKHGYYFAYTDVNKMLKGE